MKVYSHTARYTSDISKRYAIHPDRPIYSDNISTSMGGVQFLREEYSLAYSHRRLGATELTKIHMPRNGSNNDSNHAFLPLNYRPPRVHLQAKLVNMICLDEEIMPYVTSVCVFSLPDVDECTLGWHNCSHTCVNTIGGFRCECHTGYEMTSDLSTCRGWLRNRRLCL